MRIRRSRLFKLRKDLEAMPEGDRYKWSYAVTKNLRKVVNEIEDMEIARRPSKEVIVFQRERLSLCEKYAKREGGSPMMKDGNYVIDDQKQEEFSQKVEELREKFKNAIDQFDRRMDEYQESLDKEMEMDFHWVRFEDIPQEIAGVPKLLEPIIDWVIGAPEDVVGSKVVA